VSISTRRGGRELRGCKRADHADTRTHALMGLHRRSPATAYATPVLAAIRSAAPSQALANNPFTCIKLNGGAQQMLSMTERCLSLAYDMHTT
jgi:hypothetical protein